MNASPLPVGSPGDPLSPNPGDEVEPLPSNEITASPRDPIVAIVRGLPDALFAALALAGRTMMTVQEVVVHTGGVVLDTVSRPAPVQDALRQIEALVRPVQERGVVARRDQMAKLSVVGQEAGAVVTRVSMRVIEVVPLDAIISQIDLNALLARIDIGPIVQQAVAGIDLGPLIRESTTGVGGEVRDVAREGAMKGDIVLARIVDRILRRDRRETEGPALPTLPAITFAT